MYVRIVTSKQKHKTYRSVQIVDSFRDPARSKHPITKVIAHLGQVDQLTDRDVDNIINGVCKAIGRPTAKEATLQNAFDFGHIFAIQEIWKRLKFDNILQTLAEHGGQSFDLEKHIQLMVINRLCDPRSKLGLLDWLQGVYFPGVERDGVEYHHLLRSMDWLIENKDVLEERIASKFLSLFTQEVDMVFYDITSTYFEGENSLTEDDLRAYGYSRDHRPERRQIVIGLVMAPNGIPLCHHVFDGSRPDKTTVADVVRDLKKRFALRNVVFVGDRGMLSEANLEVLLEESFGFIVAHRLRRNNIIQDFIKTTHNSLDQAPESGEQFRVDVCDGVQFVMAYDPRIADDCRRQREARIEEANAFIREIRQRLKKSLAGQHRGRPLTAEGALLQVNEYLQNHHLSRYYHLRLDRTEGIHVSVNRQTRQWETLIDGKLIVETTLKSTIPEEVIHRYKDLQLIERAFRCLKSSLKLRPVHHWTEKRIRAHVFLCVLALQVERYMQTHLQDVPFSVQSALDKLKNIKAGQILLNEAKTPIITTATEEQRGIYKQLKLSFPNISKLQ